jgi:Fe-S-cluster-containing dehydrogenase component
MAKVFIVDADKCNGCYNCQLACKDENVGNTWLPYSLPQPSSGHFWMRLEEKEHGSTPKISVEYTPIPCMHCDDAPCIKAAPEAVYKRDDGMVIIDPEKSKNNKALVDVCPYGAIYYNTELSIPQKCTGCAHLLDESKQPHCVDLCATGGIRFGEEEDFLAEIAIAEVWQVELGTKPRVYYLNQPHLFIAGDIWNPKLNEIVEAAVVTLTGSDGQSQVTTSDDLGDFWFRKLEAGTYSLRIDAKGYESVELTEINLSKSENLGDFPLQKK